MRTVQSSSMKGMAPHREIYFCSIIGNHKLVSQCIGIDKEITIFETIFATR